MWNRASGWLALVLTFSVASGVLHAASPATWPVLEAGKSSEALGNASIPRAIREHLNPPEGSCEDYRDDSGILFSPKTIFFRDLASHDFAVVSCVGIHSDVTTVYERTDEGISRHLFAKTYEAGYFATSWLANVSVGDPKRAILESFAPEGACGEVGRDYYYTYSFKDGGFLLTQVESRNCINGSWKTIFEVKE